jgi:hypothetical protein
VKGIIEGLTRAWELLSEYITRKDDDDRICDVYAEIKRAIEVLENPCWETPEQWEKRTGEPWPDEAAVYIRAADGSSSWIVKQYLDVKIHNWLVPITIICATEAGRPPDNWKPRRRK